VSRPIPSVEVANEEILRAESNEEKILAHTDFFLACIRDNIVQDPDGEIAQWARGRFGPATE
jgi:hypothetical protein